MEFDHIATRGERNTVYYAKNRHAEKNAENCAMHDRKYNGQLVGEPIIVYIAPVRIAVSTPVPHALAHSNGSIAYQECLQVDQDNTIDLHRVLPQQHACLSRPFKRGKRRK